MEEINYEQQQIDMNIINALYDQEKKERTENNKIKCLEASINIVNKKLKIKKYLIFSKSLINS